MNPERGNFLMKTRIKELRQEKKYTQELLALKTDTNQTFLSRIECGLAVPDADLVVRLSAAFHVSSDYLLCLSDQRNPADSGKNKKTEYAPWLQRLNPTQRAHLRNFLESMDGSI